MLCSVINGVWYLIIDLDDDVTLNCDQECPHFDVAFYESRNLSNFYFNDHLDDTTPDYQKVTIEFKTLIVCFVSICSITNGVRLSIIDPDDDNDNYDYGYSHFDVIFHGTTNLSNFNLHSHDNHDFQKFDEDNLNFKLVSFATIFATTLIANYDYSLVTTKANFQRFTSAHSLVTTKTSTHETVTQQHFLSSVKKKVYKDFMYFSIPCLALEFVHYLPTNNHGMFKRLCDIEHYNKHLSHHLKKLSTADMSDIAKFEHYTTTDSCNNEVIPYTFITSDHRLVIGTPGMMSRIVKKSSISLIHNILSVLLICAVVIFAFYLLTQVLSKILCKCQWLTLHPANVCDHGDGLPACFFTLNSYYRLVHLLCKVCHWYLVDNTSVSIQQEIDNSTHCLIDWSLIISLFYQKVNKLHLSSVLSLVKKVVNALWCPLRFINHFMIGGFTKFFNDVVTVACSKFHVACPCHGVTTSRLLQDVQGCTVTQQCDDTSSACVVTGKKTFKFTLDDQNTTYLFTPEKSPTGADITSGIGCEGDVELVACVEEIGYHWLPHTSTDYRNASHSFEKLEPKESNAMWFISQHSIGHVDTEQHPDEGMHRIAEECSDNDELTTPGIVQEEVTDSLENCSQLICCEESSVPESVPVTESNCDEMKDHITVSYSHLTTGNDDNSDDDVDNHVDDSCDADKVDDGDDEDSDDQSSQFTVNKSIYDDEICTSNCLKYVNSFPPQEYDDQRSELTIPSLTSIDYQSSHHIINDPLRPIGYANKPQPSHTDQPTQFGDTTADRDGGLPRPVQAPSQLPSSVVPDGIPVVQTALPHSEREDCRENVDTRVRKDYAQHGTYVEKDGRLPDAAINVGVLSFPHVGHGGAVSLDAQLINEQPRQLENLPVPGPHYDYLYDTKFDDDVPVSYEEVKQRTNTKTTFLRHEIEGQSHKPAKPHHNAPKPHENTTIPHHNTQHLQHTSTTSAGGVVKSKTLPKRSCMVIGNKQFPLDPNLLAHPHMDKYFVKDRTEMKPGHFLAKLTLHHNYLDKLVVYKF